MITASFFYEQNIIFWGGILNASIILYHDYQTLENCTDTYNNVNNSKEKMCTDFM